MARRGRVARRARVGGGREGAAGASGAAGTSWRGGVTRAARLLARYEADRSPLDRGPAAARVLPYGRVPFVPGAAIVVRRDLRFDETLVGGEDVEFVWRVPYVRYEPSGQVAHDHRTDPRAWLRRRVYYGRTAAGIAKRHPGKARPLYVSPWTTAAWVALAARRPITAARDHRGRDRAVRARAGRRRDDRDEARRGRHPAVRPRRRGRPDARLVAALARRRDRRPEGAAPARRGLRQAPAAPGGRPRLRVRAVARLHRRADARPAAPRPSLEARPGYFRAVVGRRSRWVVIAASASPWPSDCSWTRS